LMLILPLVGWGMLSAGHYPIVLFGPLHLPPILPANPLLYTVLRRSHTILAYLLFLTFLAHLGAVLFHTLIIRDRLLDRMALWRIPSSKANRVKPIAPGGTPPAVPENPTTNPKLSPDTSVDG
jgi:hypothetical protein